MQTHFQDFQSHNWIINWSLGKMHDDAFTSELTQRGKEGEKREKDIFFVFVFSKKLLIQPTIWLKPVTSFFASSFNFVLKFFAILKRSNFLFWSFWPEIHVDYLQLDAWTTKRWIHFWSNFGAHSKETPAVYLSWVSPVLSLLPLFCCVFLCLWVTSDQFYKHRGTFKTKLGNVKVRKVWLQPAEFQAAKRRVRMTQRGNTPSPEVKIMKSRPLSDAAFAAHQ